jgi:hypothetical protein
MGASLRAIMSKPDQLKLMLQAVEENIDWAGMLDRAA